MRRLLLVLAFVPLPACAWTRVSDQQIAQMSAELAPPDLRLLIQRFPREYARGLDRAFADAGEIHGTNLRQSTERETRKIVAMIRTNQPMSAVVEQLGILAHLVGDANNPFNVRSTADLEPSRTDFEGYFERALPKFPTVFYGLEHRFQLGMYLDQAFAQAAWAAPIGKLTGPVRSAFGYHIIITLAKRYQPLAEVSSTIKSNLEQQVGTRVLADFITGIVKKAKIVVNPRYGDWDAATQSIVEHQFFRPAPGESPSQSPAPVLTLPEPTASP